MPSPSRNTEALTSPAGAAGAAGHGHGHGESRIVQQQHHGDERSNTRTSVANSGDEAAATTNRPPRGLERFPTGGEPPSPFSAQAVGGAVTTGSSSSTFHGRRRAGGSPEQHVADCRPRSLRTTKRHQIPPSDAKKNPKIIDEHNNQGLLVHAPPFHDEEHPHHQDNRPELFPEDRLVASAPSQLRTSSREQTRIGREHSKEKLNDANEGGLVHASSVHRSIGQHQPSTTTTIGATRMRQSSIGQPSPPPGFDGVPGAHRVDNPDGVNATTTGVLIDSMQRRTTSARFPNGAMYADAATPPRHAMNAQEEAFRDFPGGSDTLLEEATVGVSTQPKPKSPNKRAWCALGIVGFLIVLVAVAGLAVGLTSGGGDDGNNSVGLQPTLASNNSPSDMESMEPSSSPTISFWPTLSGSDWSQLGQDLNGMAAEDEYGQRLSMSGDGRTVAIASTQALNRPAYIQIFRIQDDDQQWVQTGATLFQNSGSTVALSYDGSRMIVGTVHIPEAKVLGMIEVFELDTNVTWVQLGSSTIGGTLTFGFAVHISGDGNVIAVVDRSQLSLSDDTNLNNGSGSVALFRVSADEQEIVWMPLGGTISGEAGGDNTFSASLSFDGSVVAIGAIDNDGSSAGGFDRGHVRVFEFVDDFAWVQRGADLEPHPLSGKEFGFTVDLSDDGSLVAVGDPLYETSISGNSGGGVSVYLYDGEEWKLKGDVIEGDAPSDFFGFSLSLSGDGSIVIVGAPGLNFASQSGYARAFHWVQNRWVQIGEDLQGDQGGVGTDFGFHLSMSADGRIVTVSDPSNDNAGAPLAGRVRIFELI